MLDTIKFTKLLIEEGFTHLVVVPCSFAKNLINASINNSDKIPYVPCASEAVGCSVAAGLSMTGQRPIVIVQSSGLTNMGSCITSLLMPYDLKFPIITSWRTYEAGDSEIQHAHLATRLPDLIDAYGYEHVLLDLDSEVTAKEQIKACEQRMQICVLQKDTFSPVKLETDVLNLSKYPKRSEYLKMLNEKFSGTEKIFIGTTGNTARDMGTFMPDTSNFFMVGNMGGALSLGLGAAMAGRDICVCGGDAEFVMHMGGLTTAGRYNKGSTGKLIYIMFDNESNKSTGGQRTYQDHLNYSKIVEGSSISVDYDIVTTVADFAQVLEALDEKSGIHFVHVKASYDAETPRPEAEIIINSTDVFLNK